MIKATQEQGYGKYEFDLQNEAGEYIGIMRGTNAGANGIIWEVQRWRNGQRDGSIMRLPVMSESDALRNAESFVSH